MNIDDILERLPSMKAQQIVELIRQGNVTFEELEREGGMDFPYAKRQEVRELLSNTEITDWSTAVALDTIESYRSYIDKYPSGAHLNDALAYISKMEAEAAVAPPPFEETQVMVDPEEEAWKNVDRTRRKSLRNFLESYPYSIHAAEANYLIQILPDDFEVLKTEMEKQTNAIGRIRLIDDAINDPNSDVTVNDIYEQIRKDHNWLSEFEIRTMTTNSILSSYELMTKSGINSDFIRYLSIPQTSASTIPMSYIPIENIPGTATEVYFWGIPSSGKTCTIGAVLSELRNGNVVDYTDFDSNSQGYAYMNQLSMLFSTHDNTNVFQLPPGNPIEGLFAMRCDVVRDNQLYPLTFIDVAGEMLISMYMRMAGLQLTPDRDFMLNKLTEILTDNDKKMTKRKIHFFVIEYGGQDRKIELNNGTFVDQVTLLDGVKNYINNHDQIFTRATDAIYILMTKSDLAGGGDIRQELKNYIKDHYQGFYRSLVGVCRNKKYEINKGNVVVMPFTLGDVCFKSLCRFNPLTARNVINTILSRVWSQKIDKTSRFFNILKG
ncbi:MAG: hypothetical protein HDS53_00455 [Barnesiella sp.]|nr:hypothetical protein [Barnesiella sp.]